MREGLNWYFDVNPAVVVEARVSACVLTWPTLFMLFSPDLVRFAMTFKLE